MFTKQSGAAGGKGSNAILFWKDVELDLVALHEAVQFLTGRVHPAAPDSSRPPRQHPATRRRLSPPGQGPEAPPHEHSSSEEVVETASAASDRYTRCELDSELELIIFEPCCAAAMLCQ